MLQIFLTVLYSYRMPPNTKMMKLLFVCLLIFVHVESDNTFYNSSYTEKSLVALCKQPFTLLNHAEELNFCKLATKCFETFGICNVYPYTLTSYLGILERFNCPQFQTECELRTVYDIHPYASKVYDYFCNHDEFQSSCTDVINQTLRSAGLLTQIKLEIESFNDIRNVTFHQNLQWKLMIRALNSSSLQHEHLIKPCVQVALYELSKHRLENYYEVCYTQFSFVGYVWYGMIKNMLNETNAWMFTPTA